MRVLEATTPDAPRRGWRDWVRYGAAAALLLALTALGARLAFAPIHSVRTAAECARAYAEARTHADTLSVDMLSYPGSPGEPAGRRVCGGLRRTATLDLTRP
jgi:hypothetical protein